jgi:hypothetical protein
LNPEWLKKFRDDKTDPRSRRGGLERFRDDQHDPDWLERFADDEAPSQSRPSASPRSDPRSDEQGVLVAVSRNIRLFEWLMYVSFLFEIASTGSDSPKLAKLAGGWPVVVLAEVFTIAFFGIFVFLAVYRRKKWALYVIAAFYSFRLLRYIPSFAYIAVAQVQFLSAVEFALQGLALFYAFSEEARRHFSRRKPKSA